MRPYFKEFQCPTIGHQALIQATFYSNMQETECPKLKTLSEHSTLPLTICKEKVSFDIKVVIFSSFFKEIILVNVIFYVLDAALTF